MGPAAEAVGEQRAVAENMRGGRRGEEREVAADGGLVGAQALGGEVEGTIQQGVAGLGACIEAGQFDGVLLFERRERPGVQGAGQLQYPAELVESAGQIGVRVEAAKEVVEPLSEPMVEEIERAGHRQSPLDRGEAQPVEGVALQSDQDRCHLSIGEQTVGGVRGRERGQGAAADSGPEDGSGARSQAAPELEAAWGRRAEARLKLAGVGFGEARQGFQPLAVVNPEDGQRKLLGTVGRRRREGRGADSRLAAESGRGAGALEKAKTEPATGVQGNVGDKGSGERQIQGGRAAIGDDRQVARRGSRAGFVRPVAVEGETGGGGSPNRSIDGEPAGEAVGNRQDSRGGWEWGEVYRHKRHLHGV